MAQPFLLAGTGLLGLVTGSFLTVVAHRLPDGESIVRPGSHCPTCRTPLRPVDNVPVLSYLLRRGRCRACAARIPVRYLLVEVVTCALFVAVPARVHGGFAVAAYLVLAAALVALSVVDLERMRLPTPIVLAAALLGLPLLAAASAETHAWGSLGRAAIAAAACGAAFLAIALAVPKGLGLGDVRLAALLGAFLGWLGYRQMAVGFLLALLTGGVVGVALLLAKRGSRSTRLPFGPFLAGGSLAAVLWGTELSRWWLGLH